MSFAIWARAFKSNLAHPRLTTVESHSAVWRLSLEATCMSANSINSGSKWRALPAIENLTTRILQYVRRALITSLSAVAMSMMMAELALSNLRRRTLA
eukprot:4755653-Amphidinium_carterae.1